MKNVLYFVNLLIFLLFGRYYLAPEKLQSSSSQKIERKNSDLIEAYSDSNITDSNNTDTLYNQYYEDPGISILTRPLIEGEVTKLVYLPEKPWTRKTTIAIVSLTTGDTLGKYTPWDHNPFKEMPWPIVYRESYQDDTKYDVAGLPKSAILPYIPKGFIETYEQCPAAKVVASSGFNIDDSFFSIIFQGMKFYEEAGDMSFMYANLSILTHKGMLHKIYQGEPFYTGGYLSINGRYMVVEYLFGASEGCTLFQPEGNNSGLVVVDLYNLKRKPVFQSFGDNNVHSWHGSYKSPYFNDKLTFSSEQIKNDIWTWYFLDDVKNTIHYHNYKMRLGCWQLVSDGVGVNCIDMEGNILSTVRYSEMNVIDLNKQ